MAQHRPAPAPGSSTLADSLDTIKTEFDLLASEVTTARRERDDCEAALTLQVNELNVIRQSLYELETQHGKLRHQYEEELTRLRAELHVVRQGLAPRPPPLAPPIQDVRERERMPERTGSGCRIERATERGTGTESVRGRGREREPKRLKTERGRLPAGPPPSNPPALPDPPPAPPVAFLDDLDLPTMPPHLKKESSHGGTEWFAVWNPAVSRKRIADMNLLHTLLHESVVCCVRFSKDGRFLATGCNRTAQVYDARTGTKVCVSSSLIDPSVPKGGDLYIRSVCFSPDGALLATGAEDTQIRVISPSLSTHPSTLTVTQIWDISKKRIISVLSGHQQEIYALDFSSDGRFVVSGSGDKTVRIWDMRGVSPSAPMPAQPPSCQVLTITDTAPPPTSALARTSPAPTPDGGITSVAISPSGTRVAAGSLDALVRVWDVRTGALVRRLKGHGDSVYSVAFVPDSGVGVGGARGLGLVSGGLDRTVRGWDVGFTMPAPSPVLQGWKEPGTMPLQGWKEGAGAAPKGWKDAEDDGKCTMTVHRTQGKVLYLPDVRLLAEKTGQDYVLSVAVSHDGEWVVSGSKDRGVQFWDCQDRRCAVHVAEFRNFHRPQPGLETFSLREAATGMPGYVGSYDVAP
ncbi:chromatin associated protein [Mycena rebaudengoi]|nr:chromatin associated protein [Mycena rebaudengoi]